MTLLRKLVASATCLAAASVLFAQSPDETATPLPSPAVPAGPRPTATVTPLQSSPEPTATVTPLPSASPAGYSAADDEHRRAEPVTASPVGNQAEGAAFSTRKVSAPRYFMPASQKNPARSIMPEMRANPIFIVLCPET